MSYIVQQVRSTEEGKRPRAEQLAEGQIALNVNNASPGVFLRTTTDKVVKVGGVSVGPTTPFAVYNNEYSIGELWFDTTVGDLKVYDGELFVPTSSASPGLANFKKNIGDIFPNIQAIANALGNDPVRSQTVDANIQSVIESVNDLSVVVTNNELSRVIGQDSLEISINDEAELRFSADTNLATQISELSETVTDGDSATLSSANAYTDTAVDGVIGSAPVSLNTLGELAAAIDNDASFASTTQASLDLKANITDPLFLGVPRAPTAAHGTQDNQIATTAFVVDELTRLVDAAPGALDTLNEIAAALGDDANFAATITNSIAAIQSDVDQNELDADTAILELDGNVNDLITLSGVAENATDLGTFTGATIGDSSTLKAALQALETAQEATQADVDQNEADADSAISALDTRIAVFELDPGPPGAVFNETDANVDDLVTLSGVAENSTDLGTFTGDIIPDNVDIKAAIQELETRAMHDNRVHLDVHNNSGGGLVLGDVVYVSGTHTNGKPTVAKADADGTNTYPAVGIVSETIADGGEGDITINGLVEGLDTDTPAWDAGTALYLDTTAGNLTSTRPTAAGTKVQKVALVSRRHASAGSVIVMGAGRSNDVPNELTALTGVALNDTDLGTFTGSTIADNETIKGALQDLEDKVEVVALLDGSNIPGPYADDTAAASGGVPVGGLYKVDGGNIAWRVS